MYDQLINRLRYCGNFDYICECGDNCVYYDKSEEETHEYYCTERLLNAAADAIEELLWCINYMATCDNCKYFGGCCCDHVDGSGNCLGWELLRRPTEEEKKHYEEYMEEAVRIAKQVLEERKS